MDKFNNRYRIPSARATWWNYADNAPYFVTICTKHRECFFGDIVETQYFASPSQPHENALTDPPHDIAVTATPPDNAVPPAPHDNASNSPSYDNSLFAGRQNISSIPGAQNIASIPKTHNIASDHKTQNIAFDPETQNIAFDPETQNIASLHREMKLSAIGEIAHTCWLEIPEHFPFVKLGEFVVMPDHVHGIIIIDKPEEKPAAEENQLSQINQFGPQSKNLASIVRGYKVGVTKNARLLNPNFAWQTRYHDHIIRTEASYNSISAYIINNPRNYNSHKRIK